MPTTAIKEHCAGNVTFLAGVAKVAADEGTVAAYNTSSRVVVFGGVTYYPSPHEPSRPTRKIGLEPDSYDFSGVFDDVITEADVQADRWRGARVVTELVNQLDLTQGSILRQVGTIGETTLKNNSYSFEVVSLSNNLNSELGDLTSPSDRRRRISELGINIAPFTHTTVVIAVTSQREFKVSYTNADPTYFNYGLALFTSGEENEDLEMEIKTGATVGSETEIELQLPMRGVIEVGDLVTLYAGYDGSREQARDKFNCIRTFQGEPDVSGMTKALTYPE